MFDMIKIGRKISDMRKEKDMTQMELAEKLNISYQAVSNWERGNSMPDISKLPELAQLFNISIDDLLDESSPMINHIIDNTVDEYCQNDEVNVSELAEIAPIMKPSQINATLENFKNISIEDITDLVSFLDDDTIDEFSKNAKNPNELVKIAAYVSENVLDDLIIKFVNQGEDINCLLPFAGEKALNYITNYYFDNQMFSKLKSIYPYLSNMTLDNLAKKSLEIQDDTFLKNLAPFLSKKILDEIIIKLVREDRNINYLLPFAGKNTLNDITNYYFDNKMFSNLNYLYPFLSDMTLDNLAQKSLEIQDDTLLKNLAPFLDDNSLAKIVKSLVKNGNMDLMKNLAPFLDSSIFSKIIKDSL